MLLYETNFKSHVEGKEGFNKTNTKNNSVTQRTFKLVSVYFISKNTNIQYLQTFFLRFKRTETILHVVGGVR